MDFSMQKSLITQESVQITSDSIKKKFKNTEPMKAILELVWNGLDANATNIIIKTERNKIEGLESITIYDDGVGINFDDGDECGFRKFDDSSKKFDIDSHGKDGIGRFTFHKLSTHAEWITKRKNTNYKVAIDESNLNKFELYIIDDSELPKELKKVNSGTLVRLTGFYGKGKLPNENAILKQLSYEFGWFLAYKQGVRIAFDGNIVKSPAHIPKSLDFEINHTPFQTTIYRWLSKPTGDKSYVCFVNKNGKVIHKVFSRFNNKPKFYTSAVVYSKFNDSFDSDLFEMDGSREIINEVLSKIHEVQSDLYHDFLRESADNLVQSYEEKGFFSCVNELDSDFEQWRIDNTKKIVKELYLTDPTMFNGLKEKPAKILVRLLDKVLVSNENEALFDVLEDVLDLDSEHIETLSRLIANTKLENIITTVEIISKRLQVIKMLKQIMTNKYKEVLETPDLQKIIEAHSWLFGEQYTILGAEEDDFNATAKALRNQIKGIDEIETQDVEDDATVEGAKRQVDLFLSRKQIAFDEQGNKIYKCVIIEIKRPSVSLNQKHLLQLKDYANIIRQHPEFGTTDKMRFDLILVGRKISNQDTYIKAELESAKYHQERGLVSKDAKIKCYVKDWFSLLHELELSNGYILENLKPQLPDYSTESGKTLVEELQRPIP